MNSRHIFAFQKIPLHDPVNARFIYNGESISLRSLKNYWNFKTQQGADEISTIEVAQCMAYIPL